MPATQAEATRLNLAAHAAIGAPRKGIRATKGKLNANKFIDFPVI